MWLGSTRASQGSSRWEVSPAPSPLQDWSPHLSLLGFQGQEGVQGLRGNPGQQGQPVSGVSCALPALP